MKGGKKQRVPDNFTEEEEYLENIEEKVFFTVRDTLISNGCVFFGAYANRMYLKDLKRFRNKNIPKVPDFDVLSEDPETTSRMIKERLEEINIKKIKITKKPGIGEIIAPHYEVSIGPETVVFIYEPIACHSYNVINLGSYKMRVATLDTMLSFYLAFVYVNRPYYDANRILCMSQFLFKVQEKNRLKQKGLLRRFSMNCYGKQETMEEMREEKSKKYTELKNKKNSKDYEWYFLRYLPREHDRKNKSKKKKRKTKRKTRRKRKKKGILSRLGFGGRKTRKRRKRRR